MDLREIFEKLKRFDAYPKTLEDFRIKTLGGAAVTVISAIVMVFLFVSEFNYYMSYEIHPELFVDTSRGQKMHINVDIILPRMGCALISLDAMDVSGEAQIDVVFSVQKQRLDLDGKPLEEAPEIESMQISLVERHKAAMTLNESRCETCYGAETDEKQCCNTCDDVRIAYRKKGWALKNMDHIEQCKREGWSDKMETQKKEGCHLYGHLEVNRVAGNFHIAPGKSIHQSHLHIHDLQSFGDRHFNFTHTINHLSFGKDYPGIINPLDGVSQVVDADQTIYQYFLKVVPTTYTNISGVTVNTNQFSVTKTFKRGDVGLPGVYFSYELSPLMVKFTERKRSFFHFLTQICAIIGGIFTVASVVDSFIYHSSRVIAKKIDLGKAS